MVVKTTVIACAILIQIFQALSPHPSFLCAGGEGYLSREGAKDSRDMSLYPECSPEGDMGKGACRGEREPSAL